MRNLIIFAVAFAAFMTYVTHTATAAAERMKAQAVAQLSEGK